MMPCTHIASDVAFERRKPVTKMKFPFVQSQTLSSMLKLWRTDVLRDIAFKL